MLPSPGLLPAETGRCLQRVNITHNGVCLLPLHSCNMAPMCESSSASAMYEAACGTMPGVKRHPVPCQVCYSFISAHKLLQSTNNFFYLILLSTIMLFYFNRAPFMLAHCLIHHICLPVFENIYILISVLL